MRLSCRWASEALPAPLSPSQTASHGPPRVPGATPKAPGSQAGVASQVRNPGAQSVTHKLTYVSSAQARKTRVRPTQPRNKLRRCGFSRRPTRRAAPWPCGRRCGLPARPWGCSLGSIQGASAMSSSPHSLLFLHPTLPAGLTGTHFLLRSRTSSSIYSSSNLFAL